MAGTRKTTDEIVTEVTNAIRRDVLSQIGPLVRGVTEAVADLERALATKPRRGRPPGQTRPGRPALKSSGKKAPRGALRSVIQKILAGRSTPMALTAIREQVLRSPHFKGRDPMTLYRQIVRDINLVAGVRKVGRGQYLLGAAKAVSTKN